MNLFPKNVDFFTFFEELSNIVKKGTNNLKKLETKSTSGVLNFKKIRQLELDADILCHKIIEEANITFITSIDREDIYSLSRSLDNIIDYVENLASSITMHKIPTNNKDYQNFIVLINQATDKVNDLVMLLKHRNRKIKNMKQLIIDINKIENDGDTLLRESLEKLFTKNKSNPVQIIIWKDIYQDFEDILDECEKTALIIEEIIVKNF